MDSGLLSVQQVPLSTEPSPQPQQLTFKQGLLDSFQIMVQLTSPEMPIRAKSSQLIDRTAKFWIFLLIQ